MSPCAIILVIFGAFSLIAGLSSIAVFCGTLSVWNIHKMRQYALSVGGVLESRKVGYHTHQYVFRMPDGGWKDIPQSVSKNTAWVEVF